MSTPASRLVHGCLTAVLAGLAFFAQQAWADAGLPPDYALVGKVTDGMDTVEAIDALGTPGADGPPTQTVVIESATPEG